MEMNLREMVERVNMVYESKLMQLGIQLRTQFMEEGSIRLRLPTVVVLGARSAGKSSVLESLSGIRLPTPTALPLIISLHNHQNLESQLFWEWNGNVVQISEQGITTDAIQNAALQMAGEIGERVFNNPLRLIVKRNGVPDLTMLDLPGLSGVPAHDQPLDSFKDIPDYIRRFITRKEIIILNVFSACEDFSTRGCIRLSQSVFRYGQRTLAVFTKADKCPEGLLEKIIEANVGRDLVFVRNRIGDESFEDARAKEAELFRTLPQISTIHKSIVGIPVLAQSLMTIQATMIVKWLSEIHRQIYDKLSAKVEELNKMPKYVTSMAEAMKISLHVVASAKDSLRKFLLQGDIDEHPDAADMQCSARISGMLNQFSEELKSKTSNQKDSEKFLEDEIKVLEETKSIGLPGFLSGGAFLTLLQKKVNFISMIPFDYVEKIWSYVECVVVRVLLQHDTYSQHPSSTRRAVKNIIAKKKQQSVDWTKDMVEMEKLTVYTCNPQYTATWNELMSDNADFMTSVESRCPLASVSRFGDDIKIDHLHGRTDVAQEAFDLKMRMTAYWDIVLRRMVDNMALHILFSVRNLVNKEMQSEIINELIGPQGNGLERMMLEESPSESEKREKLEKSIELLKESKDVIVNIMDRVADNFD